MRFPIVVWTVKAEVFKNLPHHPNSLSGLVYAKWTSRPVSSVFHSSVSPSGSPFGPLFTCSLHHCPFIINKPTVHLPSSSQCLHYVTEGRTKTHNEPSSACALPGTRPLDPWTILLKPTPRRSSTWHALPPFLTVH